MDILSFFLGNQFEPKKRVKKFSLYIHMIPSVHSVQYNTYVGRDLEEILKHSLIRRRQQWKKKLFFVFHFSWFLEKICQLCSIFRKHTHPNCEKIREKRKFNFNQNYIFMKMKILANYKSLFVKKFMKKFNTYDGIWYLTKLAWQFRMYTIVLVQ